MTRSFRLAGLAALIVLGCSWPAQAGLLDILEELSGPGPFGRIVPVNILFSGFCHSVRDKERPETRYVPKRKVGIPEPDELDVQGGGSAATPINLPAHMPCIYADVRSLLAPSDDNFPRRVSAFVADAGVTFPIARPIEIGLGAGWIRFHTGGISTHRFTMTPVRFVVKPLLLIPKYRKSTKLDFLKYYIKETIIVGRLRGENFGVSNVVFDNKSWRDFVTSGGFIIDIGDLID